MDAATERPVRAILAPSHRCQREEEFQGSPHIVLFAFLGAAPRGTRPRGFAVQQTAGIATPPIPVDLSKQIPNAACPLLSSLQPKRGSLMAITPRPTLSKAASDPGCPTETSWSSQWDQVLNCTRHRRGNTSLKSLHLPGTGWRLSPRGRLMAMP